MPSRNRDNKPDEQIFYETIEEIAEEFQESHPLNYVNEDVIQPELYHRLRLKLSKESSKLEAKDDLPVKIDFTNADCNNWRIENVWKELNNTEKNSLVHRVRTEVTLWDNENSIIGLENGNKKNKFDVAILSNKTDSHSMISKSKGPGNWYKTDESRKLSVISELKHSKTTDYKDMIRCNRGITDMVNLSQVETANQRVFVFFNFHHHHFNRSGEHDYTRLTSEDDDVEFDLKTTTCNGLLDGLEKKYTEFNKNNNEKGHSRSCTLENEVILVYIPYYPTKIGESSNSPDIKYFSLRDQNNELDIEPKEDSSNFI